MNENLIKVRDFIDKEKIIEIDQTERAVLFNPYQISIIESFGYYPIILRQFVKDGKFTVKFPRIIEGDFCCEDIGLKSLEGCPEIIRGDFSCSCNELKSLDGGPNEVYGDYNCSNNLLKNLQGSPFFVKGNFNCMNNYLISLKGSPQHVGKSFSCSYNHLESLEGAPLMIEKEFHCCGNLKRFKRKDLPDSTVVKGKFRGIKDISGIIYVPDNLKGKRRKE